MKVFVDEIVVRDPEVMTTVVRALETAVPMCTNSTGYEVICREGTDREPIGKNVVEKPLFILSVYRIDNV